jgi:hypothetical protein
VLVSGIVLAQYTVSDRMAQAHAMASLVEQADEDARIDGDHAAIRAP